LIRVAGDETKEELGLSGPTYNWAKRPGSGKRAIGRE